MKAALKTATALLSGALLTVVSATAYAGTTVGKSDLKSTPFATSTYGQGVVSGKAHLLSRTKTGATKVIAYVEGLTPGTTHIGHVHNGNCENLFPGVILHGLKPMVINAEGVGVSKTVIPETLAGIEDCEWWVAIHEGPENSDPQSPAVAVGPVLINGHD